MVRDAALAVAFAQPGDIVAEEVGEDLENRRRVERELRDTVAGEAVDGLVHRVELPVMSPGQIVGDGEDEALIRSERPEDDFGGDGVER